MDLLLFNPKKSKLLCYNMLLVVKPVVYLCDVIVDVVVSKFVKCKLLSPTSILQTLMIAANNIHTHLTQSPSHHLS